jgi:predicted DNA-binding protein
MRKQTTDPLKPFSVPISESLKKKLSELAKADHRPVAPYVRLILEEHVRAAETSTAKR